MPSKSNKSKKPRLKTTENLPTQGDVIKRLSYDQEERKLKAFKKAKKAKSNKGMAKIRAR